MLRETHVGAQTEHAVEEERVLVVERHAGVGRAEHERVFRDGDDAAGQEAVAAKVDEGDERQGEAEADLLALVVDVEIALELVRCGLHGQVVGLCGRVGQ